MTTSRIGRCILLLFLVAAPGSLEAQLCNGELCPGRIFNPPGLQWDQQGLYVPSRDQYLIATTTWSFPVGDLIGQFLNVDGTAAGGQFPLLAGGPGGITYAAMAYNPDRDEILLITRDAQPTTIRGIFLGSDGQPNSAPFHIGSGEAPHVAYSPHSQRYLVTFSGVVNGSYRANYVVVTGDSTQPAPVLGGGLIDILGSLSDVVEYSTVSQKFLVVYTKDGPPPLRANIRGRFFGADGTPGPVFAIDNSVESQQLPRLAYSSSTDRFLVVYEDWATKNAHTTGTILDANGNIIRRFSVAATNAWDTPGPVGYNAATKTFIATWRSATDVSLDHRAQELSAVDGSPVAASLTFTPFDSALLSMATRPHPGDPQALILWRNLHGEDGVHAGIYHLPPVTTTVMLVDAPTDGAALLQPFTVSGWAADPGAPGGTGVSEVHVWAHPEVGSATFLGVANYGIARPGVAVYLGHPRFEPSGFSLGVNGLPDGDYRLAVYARSTVTGEFDGVEFVDVTIGSDPHMNVDLPLSGAMVSAPFDVKGWAIDRTASSGTGVDAVHVWAYPAGNGAPTFLGAASYGISRPGVAAAFGDSDFEPSGFSLTAGTYLPAGPYTVRVFARSTLTGTFNNFKDVPVTIVGTNYLTVDRPWSGGHVAVPFDVSGWAVNTGATSGVGIDAVDVWDISTNTFLGRATLGISRPGVATYFGDPRFEPSGFKLTINTALAAGSHTLRIWARNAMTGLFEVSKDVQVNVVVGSTPMTFVDSPTSGSTTSTPFEVKGWAADLGASSGTGVDAVHVWAFPAGGGAGVFLGSATLGINRPGVAIFLGNPNFQPSGYSLTVNSLAPGDYTIAVYARSTVSGSFYSALPVSVTVN